MKSTILLLLLLIAFGGQAQTSYTWTGSASTDWSNASNWSPTGTPGTGDNVTVGGGTNILTLTANTTVNNLTMSAGTVRLGGYVLTSTGQVQLLGGTVENGRFIHNSATQTAMFYNTTLDCKVQTTGKVASMNASKFKDSLNMSITQGFNGGGNKFYDYTAMAFSGSGQETNFGLYNPDTFFAPVKFSVLSYHNLTLAYYSYGSYFADTVYLNNVSGIGTVIKVGHVSCGSTFAGDIVVNALAGAGNIHFAVGVQHDGRIRIGSQGFLTGKLMLAGYTQLDDHLIDLDGMHANATAVFGPSLTVEGEVRSTTAKGEIKSGCTFKKAVNITGLSEWNGARFKDVARLHSTAHTGGNVFEDSLFVSGGGFAMGYPTRDSCFAPASFSLTASGNLQLACSMGNYFADKVTLHHLSGNAANYIYIGSAGITSGGHFLDTIYMNVAAGGGGIIFDQGTMVHDGILAVGADGFNAGTLQLKNYRQTTAGLIDFSDMHSATSVTLSHATDITASIKRTSGPSVSIVNSILRGTTELVAPRISVVTSRFLGTTLLEKTGATADANYGNGFYAATTIRNTSSTDAELRFSWLSASPDTFYSHLVLDNRTTSVLHSTGIYKGNITFLGDSAAQFQLAYGNTLRSVLNGTADQTISVAPHLDVQFFGLDVNKPSGKVTLSGTVDVQEDLALQKGIVHSTNANLLLRDNATVTGASDSSHVQGPITKVGNDAFVFPVGRNGAYRPIAISAPSSGSAEFRGEYFPTDSDPMYAHANRDASLHYLNHEEYWMLDRLATSNTVNVTVGWNAATCGLPTTDSLKVAAYNGTTWKDLCHGTTTGNTTTGTVRTAAASTVYGPYALANYTTVSAIAGPDRVIEAGDTATIGIVQNTPAWLYAWTPATYVLDADSAITSAWPTVKTQYILEVEAENGCTQQDTMMVYITTVPESDGTSSLDFVVNNGQLIDTEGNLRPDIGIYSHHASPMLYCRDNALSFVHAKIDTVAATPDTLARVDIQFEDTYTESAPLGMGQNPHHYNYYLAHCPEGVTLTPSYNRVVYPELYDKTDLHIAGNNAWMKFEFVIHPDGDPEDIIMTFAGAEDVELVEETGQLVVTSSIGTYVFPRPAALKIDSVGDVVALGWQPNWTLSVTGDTARFTDIGAYDEEEVLVIKMAEEIMMEPQHIGQPEWSTQFGGNGYDEAMDLSTDSDGNVYMCGVTSSDELFPANNGAFTGLSGPSDAFISRFGSVNGAMYGAVPDGDRLMWSTYWGGTGIDKALALKATGDGTTGKVYITGSSSSSNLPLSTDGIYQQQFNISGIDDVLLIGIDNITGGANIQSGYRWSTLFGGSGNDIGNTIDTDASGNIYIGGLTTTENYTTTTCGVPSDGGFPKCTTSSAYTNGNAYGGGASDGFLARFNNLGALQWSTFYGGSQRDVVNNLIIDGNGKLYIAGETGSATNFPVLPLTGGSYDQPYGGGASDAFVARFSGSLVHDYCSFIGGAGTDEASALGINSFNTVYIGGSTSSDQPEDTWCEVPDEGFFPICGNGYLQLEGGDAAYGGGETDGFLISLNACNIVWSTYYGGTGRDRITDLAIDYRDYLFFTGETWSDDGTDPNLHLYNPVNGGWLLQENMMGPTDGFFGIIDNANERFYSMYFGYAVNERSNAIALNTVNEDNDYYWYIAGYSDSPNYENKINLSNSETNVTHCCDYGYQQPSSGAPGSAFITRFNWHDTFMSIEDIDESANDLNVTAYPNPAEQVLNIEVEMNTAENLRVSLYTITGQPVYNFELGIQHGVVRTQVDVSNLTVGIYVLHVNTDLYAISKKVIKHR